MLVAALVKKNMVNTEESYRYIVSDGTIAESAIGIEAHELRLEADTVVCDGSPDATLTDGAVSAWSCWNSWTCLCGKSAMQSWASIQIVRWSWQEENKWRWRSLLVVKTAQCSPTQKPL